MFEEVGPRNDRFEKDTILSTENNVFLRSVQFMRKQKYFKLVNKTNLRTPHPTFIGHSGREKYHVLNQSKSVTLVQCPKCVRKFRTCPTDLGLGHLTVSDPDGYRSIHLTATSKNTFRINENLASPAKQSTFTAA